MFSSLFHTHVTHLQEVGLTLVSVLPDTGPQPTHKPWRGSTRPLYLMKSASRQNVITVSRYCSHNRCTIVYVLIGNCYVYTSLLDRWISSLIRVSFWPIMPRHGNTTTWGRGVSSSSWGCASGHRSCGISSSMLRQRTSSCRICKWSPEEPSSSSNVDLTGLKDYIIQLCPGVTQLGRTGFRLRKSTKRRQLIPVNGTSVAELRMEMGRSQLFILPNRDFFPTVCHHSVWLLNIFDILYNTVHNYASLCLLYSFFYSTVVISQASHLPFKWLHPEIWMTVSILHLQLTLHYVDIIACTYTHCCRAYLCIS